MTEPTNKGGRPPTHGGYSRTVRDTRTAELRTAYVDLLVDELGDEISGAEAAAVGIAADTLVRLHDVNAYLDGRALLDGDGKPLAAMRCYLGLVNAAGRAVERVATLAALRTRRGKKLPTLAEYMAERDQERAGAPNAGAEDADTEDAPEPATEAPSASDEASSPHTGHTDVPARLEDET